ncbi:MAG: tRNA preQ1(34) S-adenosylmethionine ribosyltransferase-isomerase QueA [Chloroflexi bacterium]|jgi:S-adenosylmethionine:tRNA ribosyltransferase-isomerase|nr:tRNA preQ1(34) S-adenosylmethionine ribosyltransferase-isomerase QueA [Anaerolineaceae bacterium]NLI44564.1 tRNA preQ1(34) S-adenosylmethionine ribosyltransferase-isomerase QueA [Chloroflexota bacterium]HOE35584.1 tRNA preQ1(34) S-adenosylmethionine ribosyltransferase-isomerase QueA [Anaerolineaceae bacterium]HOT26032.1 tRNA preQ1(34) S-adenosylmethionine ribosyltransferase-isomerase QueA [Anaerolineaceae bacterium]HQH58288.1 tRNA preQ1(34) S-adenosylmethionine ribosyltransferase-isomerase Q
MRTNDFDYILPPEFIAQTPAEPRDHSRLLVMDRFSGSISHDYFYNIGSYLKAGDLLVVNRTRVIPARLFGRKLPGGGRVEVLLLRQLDKKTWECLVGGKGLSEGAAIIIENGPEARVTAVLEGSKRAVTFDQPIELFFASAGHVPLPPYIHNETVDPERYQTVYNQVPGSAAAPTAGLHFTDGLIAELKQKGIGMAELTLHVGLDTFAPVTEDDPTTHKIHQEWCELSAETAEQINAARARGGRVVAVGTTSVRTLESAAAANPEGLVSAFCGQTGLFILPGYRFRVVDALITNFHLPKSTLIMLVSAFAGRENVLNAYEIAKREAYRFYSFGDAMLIL